MLRRSWNALRAGDHVLVHDVDDAALPLLPGVVSLVQAAAGSNVVAIALTAAGRTRLVEPQRLAVHTDPIGFDERCWRCARPAPGIGRR